MGTYRSGFGPRGGRQHWGADYSAGNGTPIYANGPMTVTGVYPNGSAGQSGYGNTVTLRDQYGTEYRHAHLSDTAGLQVGQQVNSGDLVGRVGNTGQSSGPHDHFEASTEGNINGKKGMVDPESTNPNTGKPYADSFSMGDPNSGSLNDARKGQTAPDQPPPGDQPKPTPENPDPTKPPKGQDQKPTKVVSGKRVQRLTDRNNANGAIDECVAKTVFVNNLNISVDGSKGTGHPAGGAVSPGSTSGSAPNSTSTYPYGNKIPGGAGGGTTGGTWKPNGGGSTGGAGSGNLGPYAGSGERVPGGTPAPEPSPSTVTKPPPANITPSPDGTSTIVEYGRYLQSQGINVSEHPAFGGIAPVHRGKGHYEHRAIDVNGPPGMVEANDPVWGPKFDAVAADARSKGFIVIWRSAGHYNHMHIEEPKGGIKKSASPMARMMAVAATEGDANVGAADDDNMRLTEIQPAGTDHCQHCWMTANGSRCVFAENIPVNFEGNLDTCGHVRIEGSPDVYVGDCAKSTDNALGADRPARNVKESNKGSGNASPSNVACRQQELDNQKKETDPEDPNKDGPQGQVDPDDPNKPIDGKPGVQGEQNGQADSEQASRQRLLQQLDQDYANKDQWKGGKSSPAGNAAFQNLGYGNAGNGTAWCAAYVNSNLKDSGAGYASSLAAASPKAFKPVSPGQAQPGDVLVFSGHTAFVREVRPNGDIVLQGGNQGGGSGNVTQNVIKASNGYNYGGQSLVGVYNPHDKEWNDSHNLNQIPGGQAPGYSANKGQGGHIGEKCPPETKEEAAQKPGEGNAGDPGLFPPGLQGLLGRAPDPVFGGPGLPGANPNIDPMILAHQYFVASLDDNEPPPFSEMNTYERAKQLAIADTGNPNPSGTDIQRFIPQAQKQWWDETLAANQYRYELAVEAYEKAGVSNYRPPSPETVTAMMAYQSGWGNSRGLPNTAYEQNNPLGQGWNGSTWYRYDTKQDGFDASWEFLAFGAGGARGRYLLPTDLPLERDFELQQIYQSGFIDGNVPPAVLLIKPPL